MVFKTNCDKIKRGNFKGLNMTEFKISILGEVAIAEQAMREARDMNDPQKNLHDLIKKADELKELQRKVNEAVKNENPINSTDGKCGARLKANNELEEWLEKQEELRKNPEKEGANIFTYRHRKSRGSQADQEFAANVALVNHVQLLRLKSQKSVSGEPTQANSVNDEIQKWSYFEKMERLKNKILQIHTKTKLVSKPEASKALNT